MHAATTRTLEAALARCTALRHLRLQNTVPPSHDGDSSITTLPISGTALSRLTSLSLGSRQVVHTTRPDADAEALLTPMALLQHAARLPRLRELTLEINSCICAEWGMAVAHALASLTHIQRLQYRMPAVLLRPERQRERGSSSQDSEDSEEEGSVEKREVAGFATHRIWCSVEALTQLTALELKGSSGDECYSWLPALNLCLDAPSGLAAMVKQLRHLTHVSLHSISQAKGVCDSAILEACAHPTLCSLDATISNWR
eukprot:jgi/Ulvmu1/11952/UM082_0031.1